MSWRGGLFALWAASIAGEAAAQDIAVPSGVAITLYDVILEETPQVARFRFVSAAIDPAGEGRGFADLVDDLQYLCETVVVPSLAANGWTGEDVILSVASQETEFGVFVEGITQFFQPYQIKEGACAWTEF